MTATSGSPAAPPPSLAPSSVQPPSSVPPDPAASGTVPTATIVTEADATKVFALPRTGRASLRLSTAYRWSQPQGGEGQVRLTPVSSFADTGYQEWSIEPVGTGDAVIRSTGLPNCPPGQPCPLHALDFVVTLRVLP